ncbi:hypothetical protein [Fodinicola acaciae]|uniref:hypothetical protein n=1 Tax=Fodinicola acaciae TaxID=2681555 RepID=UPI0013D039A3|nr:hypothetical protein [Fodinicola acaciae]
MADRTETLLRNTMVERGAEVGGPPLDGRDIVRRGRRARKTRIYAAMSSIVVLVVAVLAGAMTLAPSGGTDIQPAHLPLTSNPKIVSILKGTLFLPSGTKVTLPAQQQSESPWEIAPVRGGWLVSSSNRILLVDTAGKVSPFASGPAEVYLNAVPSPDGREVALSQDNGQGNAFVRVYDVATHKVRGATSADAPVSNGSRAHVFGWYGDSVILGVAPYKGLPRVGLWDPKAGPWDRTMTDQHIGIVQGIAAGNRVLGYTWQQDNGTACVGFLEPTSQGFVLSNSVCIPDVVTQADIAPLVYLAPGGKRLAVTAVSESKATVVTVDGDRLTVGETLRLPDRFQQTKLVWEDGTDLIALGNPASTPKDAVWRCSGETGQCASAGVTVPPDADLGQFTAAPARP